MEEVQKIKCTLLFSVCLLNTDQAPMLGTPSCTHAAISMRGTFTGFSLASPSTGWSLGQLDPGDNRTVPCRHSGNACSTLALG